MAFDERVVLHRVVGKCGLHARVPDLYGAEIGGLALGSLWCMVHGVGLRGQGSWWGFATRHEGLGCRFHLDRLPLQEVRGRGLVFRSNDLGVAAQDPSRIVPGYILGDMGTFLEPFCGHVSPKVDL